MKRLCLVGSVAEVPSKFQGRVVIFNSHTWEESVLFLQGKDSDQVLFFGRDLVQENVLKLIEDYPGGLLVYSEAEVGAVMRSRFTQVVRGRLVPKIRSLTVKSENQLRVEAIKAKLG